PRPVPVSAVHKANNATNNQPANTCGSASQADTQEGGGVYGEEFLSGLRGLLCFSVRAHREMADSSLVQKIDQRLPVANEYLLLSGGARDGVLDLNPADLGNYAKGADFDLDFTLLVPALKLHDRNQPVTLDMRHSPPCHSWLSLRLCDNAVLSRWSSLDGCYFAPSLVTDWFWGVVREAVEELRRSPQRGIPTAERLERNGPLTTIVLQAGSSRVLYDLLPVVSFRGWPAVAQGWLTANHFWDGKITEEEAISGFYLLPCCSPGGGRADREWRLAFSRSEVQLKKCIPFPMVQAFQAAKSILAPVLARPRSGLSLYHLRTLLFWACDRLPSAYLSCADPDTPNCPNYFLPQCNMLEHLSDGQALFVARKLACVRSDPLEHLRAAQQAGQLKKELLANANGHGSPGHHSNGIISPSEDKLAQRLQQLVTENPGKSISVFLNPDDVTRPHFRIDDKFY
uniref:Transmembrane protein 102 n=1 Tax=Neogobius melanostomus TaxID=47308 RepID=A0A8C6SNA6_9GOBI